MEEGDITWDSTTKLATVRAVEQKLDPSNGLEKPALSGKGAQASYTMALTTQYDEIEPLGDGYFLAQKYTGETNVGLGVSMGGRENVRYLLDSKGKVLQTYDTGTDNYMEDGGERTFLVGRNTENGFGNGAIDWEGKTVIPVEPFSEGLAAVSDKNGTGFVNRNGEVVIPLQFEEAKPFSDGLAVVKKKDGTYAYIDKTGKIVIDAANYRHVESFSEGLAMVRSSDARRAGFIDQTGKEVIPCQYRWAGYFRNGATYASDAEGKNWLIDQTGKRLKRIADAEYLVYADDDRTKPNQQKNGMAMTEEIVNLPDGDHEHVRRYFDETGEISYETYRLKKDGETLYTVNITEPDRKLGTLSVIWDKFKEQDVKLEDGDQAPENTQLTVTVAPADAGITAILKNNGQTITSGEKLTLSADADITVETEVQPLDLSQRSNDVTISKDGDDWKYTEATITKNVTAATSFNGTIKNTLADGKRMLIDNTAQGVLIFESAKINSTSTAAPALTIENGANVSFSGNLEVKTGNADQYAIRNDGILTITDASTTITSTNTNGSSDKGIQVGNGAVIVSETGTTLTTSGLSNEGTVVVKEGAEAKTDGGQDLQKTYLVTVVDPGNGHTFTVKAGDIEVKSNDKVADKTVLAVQATPANGYRLETITAIPKDGLTVALVNNGTYVMPENEVTFKATFKSTYVPPVPTYYTVTLPEVEGVTTNPKAGTRTVEEGYSFSFALTLHEGYESSQPVVKANGIVVEPRESDGKYIIRNIEEDTEITIEGIIKDDPTGNATIEGETKVQAIGSTLHIYLPKAETISVYTLSGLLYEQQDVSAGSTQIHLSKGMYLVKIGEGTYKIVIR